MKIGFKKSAWVLLAGATASNYACANLADVAEQYSSELKLERAVALASLQTYNDLLESGCSYYDQYALTSLSAVSLAAAPTVPCTGATRRLFENMRQLADTANDISNDESTTQYSLGYTARQLGNALRATAAEEYAAQGSLSSDFVKGQFSALSARLTSLRLGASGFSLNNNSSSNSYAGYESAGMSGGGASADGGEGYSRLGGFINIAYGDGKKTATNLENAFSVDGSRINAGLDYRLDPYWVVGAILGASSQSLDFTRTQNVPAGKIESEGYNIMPFVLFQGEQFYASVSLGRQFVDFDSLRIVSYPSNPDPSTPDTKTESSTNALVTSLSAEFGYNFSHRQFAFEPFVRVNSSSTSIHKFVERDLNDAAFDLAVAGQDFKSRLYTFGANLRYTFTPSFAVITPFISAEQVKEANTKQHLVAAHYVNAASQTNVFQFVGDTPDDSYRVFTLGLSSVLLGGHQTTADGAVAGGVQGFINYKVVEDLRDYTLETIELGLRYEF